MYIMWPKQFKLLKVLTAVDRGSWHADCQRLSNNTQTKCNVVQFRNLYSTSLNCYKTIKNICCVKGEGAVDHSTVSRWFKKFHLHCITLMIKQGQIGLKVWIPRLCSKPLEQIRWVALGENQASLTFHSSHWFITFSTSETFRTTELYLILPKYCKTIWVTLVIITL